MATCPTYIGSGDNRIAYPPCIQPPIESGGDRREQRSTHAFTNAHVADLRTQALPTQRHASMAMTGKWFYIHPCPCPEECFANVVPGAKRQKPQTFWGRTAKKAQEVPPCFPLQVHWCGGDRFQIWTEYSFQPLRAAATPSQHDQNRFTYLETTRFPLHLAT